MYAFSMACLAATTQPFIWKDGAIKQEKWGFLQLSSQRRKQKTQHITAAMLPDTGRMELVSHVKVCGVTNVKDAAVAAQLGARYIGMILWPKSKRSVSIDTAKDISNAARAHNAEPVGVFVDEDAETIQRHCDLANIDIAQLHGEGARLSFAKLPSYLRKIYVLNVNTDGIIQTIFPEAQDEVDWFLLDSLQGGSGHTFDWNKIKDLSLNSKSGWFLAGGLNPENVAMAISILRPDLVDVSSGVTMPDGIHKDPARISAFINAAKGCNQRMPLL